MEGRTLTTAMSEAAKAAQRDYKREYMRKWRAANKDKVSENNRKYWERKAAKIAAGGECNEQIESN